MIPTWVDSFPEPDTYLCADGLVRVGEYETKPVEVLNKNGTLKIPKFGSYSDKVSSSRVSSGYDSSAAQTEHFSTIYRTVRYFNEIDPVRGLEAALNNHAVKIQSIVKDLDQ